MYLIPLYFQEIIYDFYNAIYRHGISLAFTYPCYAITSLFHRYRHASYNNFCIKYKMKRFAAVFAYISVTILLGYDRLALGRDRIIHIILIQFRLILLCLFYVNFFYPFLSVEKQAYDYILKDSASKVSAKVEISVLPFYFSNSYIHFTQNFIHFPFIEVIYSPFKEYS